MNKTEKLLEELDVVAAKYVDFISTLTDQEKLDIIQKLGQYKSFEEYKNNGLKNFDTELCILYSHLAGR